MGVSSSTVPSAVRERHAGQLIIAHCMSQTTPMFSAVTSLAGYLQKRLRNQSKNVTFHKRIIGRPMLNRRDVGFLRKHSCLDNENSDPGPTSEVLIALP